MSKRSTLVIITLVFLIFIFTACNTNRPTQPNTPGVAATTGIAASSEPTETAVPPTTTATPIPMAVVVNGEGITLAEYQAELRRFTAASEITGTVLATDTQATVLNELVDQTLLAQAAAEKGFLVDDVMVQTKIKALEDQLGGAKALEDWKNSQGYTTDEFRQALMRAIGATWMRDQIIAAVPETADQVHAYQILLTTAAEAEKVYTSLQGGSDFMELAKSYDPMTRGDLGWFPRGTLGLPSIDEAVFALQVGQYTAVVHTEIGYHILYVAEREPNRLLQPEARKSFQLEAVQSWLQDRRSQSEIKVLLP